MSNKAKYNGNQLRAIDDVARSSIQQVESTHVQKSFLGLTSLSVIDSYFDGKTATQVIKIILNKLPDYSRFEMALGSGHGTPTVDSIILAKLAADTGITRTDGVMTIESKPKMGAIATPIAKISIRCNGDAGDPLEFVAYYENSLRPFKQIHQGIPTQWVATGVTVTGSNIFNLTIQNFVFTDGCQVTFTAPQASGTYNYLWIDGHWFDILTPALKREIPNAWAKNGVVTLTLSSQVLVPTSTYKTAFFDGDTARMNNVYVSNWSDVGGVGSSDMVFDPTANRSSAMFIRSINTGSGNHRLSFFELANTERGFHLDFSRGKSYGGRRIAITGVDANNNTTNFYSETAGSAYYNGGIELREAGLVGNANVDNNAYAPRLGFHWSGVAGASLMMNKYGDLLLVDVSGNMNNAFSASRIYGAVWNDYAEYRQSLYNIRAGRIVVEDCNNDDHVVLSDHRLNPTAMAVSDTFGFSIGEQHIEDEYSLPIAVSGRVLVYTDDDRTTFKVGDVVCSGCNGTVSKMTREEIISHPECIVGVVSSIPKYERWGTGDVEVDGRIWIRVK